MKRQRLSIRTAIEEIRQVADQALESTRSMLVTKGRGSIMGKKSMEHLDPGAKSAQLLVHTVCELILACLDENREHSSPPKTE